MNSGAVKRFRLLGSIATVLVLVLLAVSVWGYFKLRASLPQLDGRAHLSGFPGAIKIERDALGVPTVSGSNRADVARGLGFLHAQDRFFQMDLARRRAAGELAALVGKAAVPLDQSARVHAFRTLAQTVLTRLPPHERSLLEAYAEGANAGLRSLRSAPFEYTLLRADPQPWKPEDCVLIIYAMTLDLQDPDNSYEQSLEAVRENLGSAALAFVAPLVGPDDAALDESSAALAPVPNERHLDIRKRTYASASKPVRLWDDEAVLPGSNCFALSGAHTASGAAMLANDMHLGLHVPNVWYRASLSFPSSVTGKPLRVTGVTLPGAPVVVAGSNGQIAWGFTNAFADVSDLVLIDVSTLDPTVYGNEGKLLQMEIRRDTIAVKGGDPVATETKWTLWGPVVGATTRHRPLALKWTMDNPDAANFDLVDLETATNVREAIAVAHRAGIPVQNFVVADRAGEIAWTICGKLPKRVGFDGRLPVSWSFGDRRWDGFVPPDEIPTNISPASGRIWSANQRMVGGDALRFLGDGGYERPARATQIRDLFSKTENAKPTDLLAVQLNTYSAVLTRWHRLLVGVLNDDAVAQKKSRGELRAALSPWDGLARLDSISYRLVKSFRRHVIERTLVPLFEPCTDLYPEFNFRHFHYEAALWEMVDQKPPNLLDLTYSSWNDLLLAAADDVGQELQHQNIPMSRATWGSANIADIRHPLSRALPLVGRWLDLPHEPLPGDTDMPRVQSPTAGASERFVVSPGHEEEGTFHMPGGQSGHPLSPFYRAGHEAWVRGEATPFLPGPTLHTLILEP